jgi:hypothetical protein
MSLMLLCVQYRRLVCRVYIVIIKRPASLLSLSSMRYKEYGRCCYHQAVTQSFILALDKVASSPHIDQLRCHIPVSNAKLSLCLNNTKPWDSRGIGPRILNLGSGKMWSSSCSVRVTLRGKTFPGTDLEIFL